MAKSLMIQGTGSGAGKSLIVAALCRIFRDLGVSVAPFKAQNMALNSFITGDGGEIGRAQALQAEAAGIPPSVDMNPILLKVAGESRSQVIVHGRVHATMKARDYYAFRSTAWKAVTASYDRLSSLHDLIVMEGAGSPAEINLRDVDIVNMAAARYAKAPVILVGDIDKGGVFASLYGTVKLLGREGRRVKAFVINKFRGDIEILRPGLEMISERTGRPVIGVIPFLQNMALPEEDGLVFSERSGLQGPNREVSMLGENDRPLRIVIARLRYISNFTDFDPLFFEPDVEIRYSDHSSEIETADIVIVPGSKNTVKDLLLLRERGLDRSLLRAHERGAAIVGLCGGYQMLGRRISDPRGVESSSPEVEGIGLLDMETVFQEGKTTCQAEAEITGTRYWGSGLRIGNADSDTLNPDPVIRGYEIHMGESSGDIGLFRVKRLRQGGRDETILDGSGKGNCWGTYLHGIFENDGFRRMIINRRRKELGLPLHGPGVRYQEIKEAAIDRLAGMVRKSIDLDSLRRMVRR